MSSQYLQQNKSIADQDISLNCYSFQHVREEQVIPPTSVVTQLTSIATPVTLNTENGIILTFSTALATGGAYTFTLNNSLIGVSDRVVASCYSNNSGTAFGALVTTNVTTAGSCSIGIYVTNAITAVCKIFFQIVHTS